MRFWIATFFLVFAGLLPGRGSGQLALAGRLCVTDAAHRALVGASVRIPPNSGGGAAYTGSDGCLSLPSTAGKAGISAKGFQPQTAILQAGDIEVVLQPASGQFSATVTADRGLPGVNDSASSVVTLSASQLAEAPALALDDRLHQVAGFQLFRRTSSWTANPTTQGVSLRGLGSTAASRTLVVSDQVPLNDPFGGWIHWNEVPALAAEQVQLVRGGSADLYGSSAIGGVIDIIPVTPAVPQTLQFTADTAGATENSSLGDALLSDSVGRVALLGAGSGLRTEGYVPTAPAARGSVDIASNVASETGRLEARAAPSSRWSTVLRGNVLNEVRSNATPLQTNGTRLWRYAGGTDFSASQSQATLRVFGSRETYRQSFSALSADRNTERLTRLQRVPTDEFGFAASGSHMFSHAIYMALGTDLRDVRATDDEVPVVNNIGGNTQSISARQRETGGYAEAIWQPRGAAGTWSLSGSVRVDSFRTFDARQVTAPNPAALTLPRISELVPSPRVGLVWTPAGRGARALPRGLSLTGTAFRAFRGPTLNELYRTGQVGQQTTLANNALLAERATGFELGGEWTHTGFGHVRATYFWTEVNRPISAVGLSQTATTQTLQRQNLGQIRSRGLMLEAVTEHHLGLDASFGYQLAVATVTRFNAGSPVQTSLTGLWIPQVPRQAVTAVVNYRAPHAATFHLIASYTGQQFDDSGNQYRLRPYARFDASLDRALPHGFGLFAGAQNLLDRNIEAGRTPVLTLAAPRLVQAGLRYTFRR